MRLQRSAGNAALTRLLAQRSPDLSVTPGTVPDPARPYRVYDPFSGNDSMVGADEYEAHRAMLVRLLRAVAEDLPIEAGKVIKDYPFTATGAAFREAAEALHTAGWMLSINNLWGAAHSAREAKQYTGIEARAHRQLMDMGVAMYTLKRVDVAIIGIVEGSAKAVVGLIDTGAGLVGMKPDLSGKVSAGYDRIFSAYGDAIGMDTTATNDRAKGVIGGQIAGGLATGKALDAAGKFGMVVNGIQALAATKSAASTIITLREHGRSWTSILTDPSVVAELAGAIAGVAGGAGSLIPRLKVALGAASQVFTGAQLAGLAAAFATYEDDPQLSEAQNFERKYGIAADFLSTAASLAPSGHGEAESTGTAHESIATDAGGDMHPIGEPAVKAAPVESPTPIESTPPAETGSSPSARPAAIDPARSGIPPATAESLKLVSDQLHLVIEVRPVNLDSVPHLEAGALSKMELVKAKTVSEWDARIGGPPGGEGLVGLFQPKRPVFPEGTSPHEIAMTEARYAQRMQEWQELAPYYEQYRREGLVDVTPDGLLLVADPRRTGEPGGKGRLSKVAGDVDIYDIRHADGSPLTVEQRDSVITVLRSMGIGVEHGAHEWWRTQSPETFHQGAYDRIRTEHTRGAGGPPRGR